MSVPDDHLVRAARQETLDRRVDFAGQQLPQFGVLGLGLLLSADAADTLRVGDQENALLRPRGGGEKQAEP
jgi:hypothetical protein